jgi:hypothetical protein
MSTLQWIKCKTCFKVKPSEEFYKQNSKFGKFKECKGCHRDRSKKFRKDNPDYYLLNTYGMTKEEYDQRLEEQGGVCANEACDYGLDEDHTLCVDHCHSTGKIRGLLCNWCNSAEGFLKSDVQVAEGLIKYMRKHNGEEEEG